MVIEMNVKKFSDYRIERCRRYLKFRLWIYLKDKKVTGTSRQVREIHKITQDAEKRMEKKGWFEHIDFLF